VSTQFASATLDRHNEWSLEEVLAQIDALPREPNAGTDWTKFPPHSVWYDRPDAYEHIAAKLANNEISAADAALLDNWVRHGFMVLENAVSDADVEGVNAFVDDLLATDIPNDGITLLGFTADPEKGSEAVPHRDIMKLFPEQRLAQARLTPWRIHEMWSQSVAAKKIYQNERVRNMCSLLFARPAKERSTINFYLGSQQDLHQDMTVFHIFPGNYLIGAWIALEDVSPDSGPLRFAPGTHRSSRFPKFANHPQTTLRNSPNEIFDEYYGFTNKIAEEHGIQSFLGKKGDVFLWHGMMVHGGSPVNDPSLTRKSMVVHYIIDGVDQIDRIAGPFNW
jgi:ectoine hydroxylase-related dioxygenase (phytanoyl-CoA dioxygenase family)